MIYEVLGIVTYIAWNESVFPNSHWGIIPFSSSCLQIQIPKAQTSPVSAGGQSKSRRSELVCTRWQSMTQRASSACGRLAVLCPCWMRAAEPTPQPKHCTATVFGHKPHCTMPQSQMLPAASQGFSWLIFQLPCLPNIPLNTTTVPIHQAVTQFPFMTHLFYQNPIKKQAWRPSSLM